MNAVPLPLTSLQLGMFCQNVLSGRPWLEVEQVVVRLDDECVETADVLEAWHELARRHDALRMAFLWQDGASPVQVVRSEPATPVETVDWSGLAPEDQEDGLAALLEADLAAGIDLTASPGWRVTWIRLAPRRAVLVWTVHHAVADEPSIAIVLEDLFALLSANGRSLQRDRPPAMTFADVCRRLAESDTTKAEAIFKRHFQGFEQPALLTGAEALPRQGIAGRRSFHEARLDVAAGEALRTQAARAGVPLGVLVHAAWSLVVARWTGSRDVVVGWVTAGRRSLPEASRTVGCLTNVLPLRVQVGPGLLVSDLLRAVHQSLAELAEVEQTSLEEIRGWCGLPVGVPLFDSMVIVEPADPEESLQRVPPQRANRRIERRDDVAFPITVTVDADRTIRLVLDHDAGALPHDLAARLLGHLRQALASLGHVDPGAPLAAIRMLDDNEEAHLRALARPDRPIASRLTCLAAGFEATAAATPAAAAVADTATGAVLSFAELDGLANGMAHRLRAAGVGPGDIVAVCLPRSPAYIATIIGVLKAGAAFLPMDPSYPEAVLRHMLTDSGARLVVADGTIDLDGRWSVMRPDAPPDPVPPTRPGPDPDRLAYVIYTSGSTGTPKGVRVPQRAITAHAEAIGEAFGLSPMDRVLQFASLSFDVSIEEIVPTLLSGAAVVLRSPAMAESVAAFLDTVDGEAVTVLNLPTAFWHVLVEEMVRSEHRLPPAVRLVVVGGERISPRTLVLWQRHVPGVRWLNGYGPTETTITCTLHEPGDQDPEEDVPIGRPAAHALAYVLAPDGSLAPHGCPGELWIGGPAVSDGYIGHPDETAASFRQDTVAGQGRIYNSGDRASWRPDGTLAFLGRRDRQVKLRGFRLDLRQIERVLEADPRVAQALCAVVDAEQPSARLVAWVVPHPEASPIDTFELGREAARRMPAHMVPDVVAVPAFPRTPGGKVDTAALPRPEPTPVAASTEEDVDPAVTRIAAMMAEVLGLAHVGPDDDFHLIGGHSLLAMRLIGLIEAGLGPRLTAADLKRNPTPRRLAAALANADTGPRYIVPIQAEGSRPPIFGVHVLGSNECYYRPLAEELGPDQPVLGLTVGPLTKDSPVGVPLTAARYAADLQEHYPEGPIHLAAVSLGAYIAFELARQLVEAGRDVRSLIMFDAEGPAGRAKVGLRSRVAIHWQRARSEGFQYGSRLARNKVGDVRNAVTMLRLRLARATGKPPPLTLAAYVAANELAVRAYDPVPIRVPLTIFRAMDNVSDSPESLQTGLGWSAVAAAGFRVIDVPGDHLSLLQPPHVRVVARHVDAVVRADDRTAASERRHDADDREQRRPAAVGRLAS